jgi:predicted flap endonuclease-1-like 5' DNA nuclease
MIYAFEQPAVKSAQALPIGKIFEKEYIMNNVAAIVLGLLIGWLVEWVIDWIYWRRRMQAATKLNPDWKKENIRLAQENTMLTREHKKLGEDNVVLTDRLAEAEDEVSRIRALAMIGHLLNKDGTHNLQAIKGIGPAFAKRLKEAGIHTFDQLAQLTPQDMEKILGALFKRFFSKENTILAQAKEFAEQIAQYGKNKA